MSVFNKLVELEGRVGRQFEVPLDSFIQGLIGLSKLDMLDLVSKTQRYGCIFEVVQYDHDFIENIIGKFTLGLCVEAAISKALEELKNKDVFQHRQALLCEIGLLQTRTEFSLRSAGAAERLVPFEKGIKDADIFDLLAFLTRASTGDLKGKRVMACGMSYFDMNTPTSKMPNQEYLYVDCGNNPQIHMGNPDNVDYYAVVRAKEPVPQW
jgi:hypothetical protein